MYAAINIPPSTLLSPELHGRKLLENAGNKFLILIMPLLHVLLSLAVPLYISLALGYQKPETSTSPLRVHCPPQSMLEPQGSPRAWQRSGLQGGSLSSRKPGFAAAMMMMMMTTTARVVAMSHLRSYVNACRQLRRYHLDVS